MKVLSVIGLASLLATPLLASPVHPETQTQQVNKLDKRTGHINVQTWSGGDCGQGKGEGVTAIGTSGKCVNMSKAGAVNIGGPSAKNPSGCTYVHAKYYHDTGCHDTVENGGIKYGPHSCVKPLYNSAFMKCVA